MCFRLKPIWFTRGPSLTDAGRESSSMTGLKILVMMTTLLRGMLNFFSAFPTMTSLFPLLYVSAVS